MTLGKPIMVEDTCPNCCHIKRHEQHEGDKYAWRCHNCWKVFENGKPFLLSEQNLLSRIHDKKIIWM